MKKLFTLSFIFFSIALFSQNAHSAQVQDDYRMSVGPLGGFVITTISSTGTSSDLSVKFGGDFDYRLMTSGFASHLYINPQMVFVGKGWKAFGLSATKAYYIAFPVRLKGKYYFTEKLSAHLAFGPYLGLKVSGAGYKSTDFGFDIGLGGEYMVGERWGLGFDFDIGIGLTNAVAGASSKWRTYEFLVSGHHHF